MFPAWPHSLLLSSILCQPSGGSRLGFCCTAAAGKLEPPDVMAQTLGGESSGFHSSNASQLIGRCPVVEAQFRGVTVACLLDTGSMVTTITQQFYEQHLHPRLQLGLQPCSWLTLKAANGLEISYLGYLDLDVHLLGRTLPRMGILVTKNPADPTASLKRIRFLASLA